jgi:hypothetical protein
MNEQELRALVREAVERHLGRPSEKRFREPFSGDRVEEKGSRNLFSSPSHPSHILLKVVPGSEADDGMCVIEPSVRCNHCGFCQSLGH